MREQVPSPTPTANTNNIPYLFTPTSLPPLISLNIPPNPMVQQIQNPQTGIDHVNDWDSLLLLFTGYNENGDQKPPPSSLTTPNGNTTSGKNNKGKPSSRNKRAVPSRVAFHTRSSEDVLDDGYRWRKYGQKAVKNNIHPRSYYRCAHHTCNVKKQIQRLSKDTSIVVTTYEGIHNHPCEKLMETLGPLLKQIQFLSRF